MSIITLQFGQCGNQLGQALYSELYSDLISDTTKKRINSDYVSEACNKWFHINTKGEWEARSILVDTENKVTSAANNNGQYKFKNIAAKSHGGSANNWAYGYTCKSTLLIEDIVEGVRKEMEKSSLVQSIMNILSTGGGTGSGVGSRSIELLRDQYPNTTIINTIVLPYKSGEVVTQNYNSLLTLAKLYDITDATCVYENDVIHQMCTKILSLTNVTFRDINSIIAQQLAALLQPVANVSASRLVASLAAHPRYKLIQIKSVPHVPKQYLKYEAASSWAVLANRIKSSFRSSYEVQDSKSEFNKRLKYVGNVLISRGNVPVLEEDIKPLTDSVLYVPWVPLQTRLTHHHQSRGFKEMNKFLVLASNNNYVSTALGDVLEDAWTLFTSGAYLHHYSKFNVNEQCFTEAFEKMETVLRDYKLLSL